MTQTFKVDCPSCGEQLDIESEVQELIDDKGMISQCPDCGAEIEYDYTPEAGLTVTPGQEFEDDEDSDDLSEDLEPELDEDDEEE